MVISFDLWGTLIKANPNFKIAKNKLIRKYTAGDLSESKFDEEMIDPIIKQIKKRNDHLIEKYGTQPDIMHLFAELANQFEIPACNLAKFYNEYQDAFGQNLPLWWDEDTERVIRMLHEDGHKLLVSSNTLFTATEGMMRLLAEKGLYSMSMPCLIDDYKFSCEFGFSKPHMNMFFLHADLHVGDNVNTDGGCINHKIKFFQINSNGKTIVDLYEHVSALSVRKKD